MKASEHRPRDEDLLENEVGTAAGCTTPGMESLRLLIEARQGKSDYQTTLAAFERANGPIVNLYFSKSGLSAVVITRIPARFYWREKRRVVAFLGNRCIATDIAEFEEAVWRAIWTARSTERGSDRLLPYSCRKVVADFLFTVLVMLINTLDAVARRSDSCHPSSADKQILKFVSLSAIEKLRQVEAYVERSELQTAVRYYLLGLPFGIAAIAATLIPFIGLGKSLDSDPLQLLIAAAAGGIGATTSVMFRITRGQNLEVNLGEGALVTLVGGAFRPLIGAVFGVTLYVLVEGGLLPLNGSGDGRQQLMFYVGLAFLAGFSERWAQDTILQSAPVTPSHVSTAGSPVDAVGQALLPAEGSAWPRPTGSGTRDDLRSDGGDMTAPPSSRFANAAIHHSTCRDDERSA
jgi:hypothetical protein